MKHCITLDVSLPSPLFFICSFIGIITYNFYDAINVNYFVYIHVKNNIFGEIQVVFIVRELCAIMHYSMCNFNIVLIIMCNESRWV